MYAEQLYQTLRELIRLPSTSGHEEQVREYLAGTLAKLGLESTVDAQGNLIAFLPGEGRPLLLNAHMDRVPPGLGHEPVLREGVLYSDGTTNLGADDCAGLTIILEVLRRTLEQGLPHPPLVLLFTVMEETGLCGASRFDASAWHIEEGLVFDNAFEAGVVVSQGAAYEAFDVTIEGKTGHPGKDLAQTVNVLSIFRETPLTLGALNEDQTRINIGRITAGSARNAVPATLTLEGELRSFEPEAAIHHYRQELKEAFTHTAQQAGGSAHVKFNTHSRGYRVDPGEPLLQVYGEALRERGVQLELRPTFIGSDASGFRASGIRAFTVSTGVVNEHSFEECVALAPLEQLVQDTLRLLSIWRNR
ncbi:M20 family peptidase [Ktedonobacter sp. SOSP1-52]|uniref:M20/M25/M40 family metallo-hydrolase n=1 Tax=Ktedonobacter sp. SOSP1-52 TaxID=2778366 RepID=UPI001914F2CF|nr:M20/M25/M40 family metallo-hydrolase [Ktedonobacter sp. SOSP1-52]GHO65607.1 M20 family peptidase [Ktedonobacter sp. SOSP1-52]